MCRHEEASDREGWEAVVTSSQQVDGALHGFQSGGPQPERPKGTKISPSVKVTWTQAAAAARGTDKAREAHLWMELQERI